MTVAEGKTKKAKKKASPETKGLKKRVAIAEAEKAELDLAREALRHAADVRLDKWDAARSYHHGGFTLAGMITTDGAAVLSDSLARWARIDDNEGKPITLTICSGGGNAYAGLWLFDQLRMLSTQGHHVTTVVRGFAGSAAGVVAQAGNVRLIGGESFIHIHEAANGILGKAQEIKDEALALEQLSRKVASIYATRSSLSSDEVYARFERREWWLSAQEALALGFADEIG